MPTTRTTSVAIPHVDPVAAAIAADHTAHPTLA